MAGGIFAVGAVTLFMCLTVNRYLPILEGFSYYGKLMHEGKLPYKDFYFYTQPICLLITWAVYSVSDKMIYLRCYGLFERACLTACLYFLMSRRFSPAASFWATVVSMLVFLNYCTEVFFTYLITCCVFFIGSLIFLYLAALKPEPWKTVNLVLAGVAASLSFFSKQSNGLFISVAVVFLALMLAPTLKQGFRDAAVLCAGWTIPLFPFILWLRHYGLTSAYILDVFQGASNSKGGLWKILFAFWGRAIGPVTCIALISLAAYCWHVRRKRILWIDSANSIQRATPLRLMTGFALLATAGILVPYSIPASPVIPFVFQQFFLLVCRSLLWISLAAFLYCLRELFRRERRRGDPLIHILIVAGFAWMYSSGLSFDIQQQAILIPLCIILAAAYDWLRSGKGHVQRIVTFTAAALVLMNCWQKYSLAFEWTGWREAISQNTATSHWPRLSGFRTDARLMGMFDTIFDDVAKYSKPGDPVFTFPHMPMINYVTDRPQPTFALVHYWDICPDWVAEEDARRVREARPKVIVEMNFDEKTWKLHEGFFRPGHPSGQRAIKTAIDDLASSGDYQLIHIFRPRYFDAWGDFIRVWARVK